jgi:hypothetical protein
VKPSKLHIHPLSFLNTLVQVPLGIFNKPSKLIYSSIELPQYPYMVPSEEFAITSPPE